MALILTEEWIRQRIQLKQDNLEDVRSLALPGTYHEKITSIDGALKNFSRLKNLDLSRNTLECLEGLEHLRMLEKVNLYYNNIGSLKELYRLRHNQKLQELDLRLNPVARNEPDYRLFLIHLLPNLRRLDDRAVRDNERRAALMHFSTEQAAELVNEPQHPQPDAPIRNPRVEQVHKLTRPGSNGALASDDIAVLDLLARTETPLEDGPIRRPISDQATSQNYPTSLSHKMDRNSALSTNGAFQQPVVPPLDLGLLTSDHKPTNGAENLEMKYPNIRDLMVKQGENGQPAKSNLALSGQGRKSHRVQFIEEPHQEQDTNLMFTDEADAYHAYQAKGNFTPAPDERQTEQSDNISEVNTIASDQISVEPTVEDYTNAKASVEFYSTSTEEDHPQGKALCDAAPAQQQQQQYEPSTGDAKDAMILLSTLECGDLISKLSNLADKYWNGSRSLVENKRYITQASKLINKELRSNGNMPGTYARNDEVEPQIQTLQAELGKLKEENTQLREQAYLNSIETKNMDDSQLKSSIIRAQRDMGILKGRLQAAMDENRSLYDKLAVAESNTAKQATSPSPEEIFHLKGENEKLRQDVQAMTVRLKQSSHVQELAAMLQESHKSLIQSNEHLLKEIEESRHKQTIQPKYSLQH